MRSIVRTEGAPRAVGPYSQAVIAGGMVWVAGQIALDPATGLLVEGGIEGETRRVLRSIGAILEEAGSGLERTVRITVYLVDLADFEGMNRVYAEFFTGEPPARATVQVCRLPRDARVEMVAVAVAG